MKKMKKIATLFFAVFISSVCVYAQPMRELPPVGSPLDQSQTVFIERPKLPISPSLPIIPENPPERDPLALPVKPRPEPGAKKQDAFIDNTSTAFSRNVKASVGQHIEIPFNGSGWVYHGEAGNQKGVAYSLHRLDKEGQSFVFNAEKAGEYALQFYKQDFIRDYTLYDNVRIVVTPPPEAKSADFAAVNRGTVIAEPRWPTAEQEAARIEGRDTQVKTSQDASSITPVNIQRPIDPPPVQDVLNNTPPPAEILPEQFIQQAKAQFDAGNIDGALSVLDQFREKYQLGDDEIIWLYAQAYEANGPSKDIKTARYYYQRIVNEFPLSSHHNAAQNRVSYIDRYYLNIQ